MPAANTHQQLFEQALREVTSESAHTAIELDINQLQQASAAEHERLAILFDLALEELDQPADGKKYLNLEELRARQHADTTSLTKALSRFERIVQAPFTARAGQAPAIRSISSYRQPIARAANKVIVAEPRDRLRALAIDIAISGFFALLVAALLSPFMEGELIGELQVSSSQDLLRYAPLLALYLKVFLLSIIIYPHTSLLLRGKTPGMIRTRIKLVSTNGTPPMAAQIVVRALLTPLSLAMLSPLSVLNRKQTIADHLSRTTLSKI